jgi:hypothetical protein
MARYDKYEPFSGGFRAPLAAATTGGAQFTPVGVGLDANGRVVAGAGVSGIVGVYIPHALRSALDIVDVMTDGEIVEMTGLVAGTRYYAATADGAISTTNTGKSIGFTVESTRLVVRMGRA